MVDLVGAKKEAIHITNNLNTIQRIYDSRWHKHIVIEEFFVS